MEGSPLLLVVDDDPAVVSAARALLGRRGYKIEAAFKGLDAVARVRAGGVDALLLDVELPEVSGLSVLEALSDLPANTTKPRVVLMSSSVPALPKVRAAVDRGEALAVLRKPIDFTLAHVLITGRVPEEPLWLTPDPSRPIAPLLRDALDGKPLLLPNDAALPEGTPVSLAVMISNQQTIALMGTAATARDGSKGLVLNLLPLANGQRAELSEALRNTGGVAISVVRRSTLTRAPTPAPSSTSTSSSQAAPGSTSSTSTVAESEFADEEPPGTDEERVLERASQLYQRGMRRLDRGLFAQALQDLSRASALQNGNLEYQAAEKRAQQLAAAVRAQQLARRARTMAITEPNEALTLLEEAIRLEPDRATHHLDAAELWLQLGDDLERAEERLGAAIHLAPSDPTPRLHFTKLLERVGRPLEALWSCDAALALFPGDHELRKAQDRLRKRLATLPQAELALQPRTRRTAG
jgi:CheY-like chemotaxis protein